VADYAPLIRPTTLIDFIRPERRFSGLDALKAQIAKDSARARAILAAVPAAV
jgi:riboflavin kinase/FMN adenylyltransferase